MNIISDLVRSDTDRAWAAGFFDGEGCTMCQINPAGYKSIRISINQSAHNREVLDKFRSITGVGRVNGPYAATSETSQPFCTYNVSSLEKVQAIIDMMWEFLGAAKRNQALVAISIFTGRPVSKEAVTEDIVDVIETRNLNNFLETIFNPIEKKRAKARRAKKNNVLDSLFRGLKDDDYQA